MTAGGRLGGARAGRRRLSLRGRLALLCAGAVALAIAVVSAVAWVVTAQVLGDQIDASLAPPAIPGDPPPGSPEPRPLGEVDLADFCRTARDVPDIQALSGGWQILSADGTMCARSDVGTVEATPEDNAAALGVATGGLRDTVTSDGTAVRVRTIAVTPGYALLIMRDLSDVRETLRQLAWVLVVVTALGSLAALVTGWWVARASLRPLDDLTATAEHIATTEDLDVPITVRGTDEISRLAVAFNQMTSALSASRVRQQQLVADASHELRTPLTSLRTNVELLARAEDTGRTLGPVQRHELLDSLVAQTAELSHLVTELTVLAHDEPAPEPAPVDLVGVVRRAVTRAGRRGEHLIVTDLQPWVLLGDGATLERAVLNILDNAMKFSPRDSTIAVTLHQGVLDVDDAGPGISAAERGHAFDRFWRSPGARSQPGSGLGLAIVADAVHGHGGSAEILTSPAGGARVRLRLPGAPAEPAGAHSVPGTATTSASATPPRTSASPSTSNP